MKLDKEHAAKMLKQSRDAFIIDILLQGSPEALKEITIAGINKAMYLFEVENGLTDKYYDDWKKTSSSALFQYNKDSNFLIEDYGMLGIQPSKFIEAYATHNLAQHGVVEGYKDKKSTRVDFKPSDKSFLQVIEFINWANSVGIMDAYINTLSNKAKRAVVEKYKQQKVSGKKKGKKKGEIKPSKEDLKFNVAPRRTNRYKKNRN